MFTVCSKCNLRLTVTATDLRAAQGYVRCGRCHNVFNALATLADDPALPAEQASTADTQRRPVLTAAEPQRPDPPMPESTRADSSATEATDTSLEFNPASTNINEVFIEAAPGERTGTFESIILVGEELPESQAGPDPVIATQAPSEPEACAAADPGLTEGPATPDDEVGIAAPDGGVTVDDAAARGIAGALDAAREDARFPRRARQGAAWLLTLCLIVQVVHHYRSELAGTALLHRSMTAAYEALGLPLAVRWNIADYEIRQLGATTEGTVTGDLMVRASISNRAAHDQPLPLLRVVMQDRFGNRVAARDLLPSEYLGRGAPRVSLMAPGQRVDVQVAFQDPGQAATGFELDACMARHDRTVTCANDPGGH